MKIEVDDFTYAVIRTVQAILNDVGKDVQEYSEELTIQTALLNWLTFRQKGNTWGEKIVGAVDNVKDMQKAIELERKMQK